MEGRRPDALYATPNCRLKAHRRKGLSPKQKAEIAEFMARMSVQFPCPLPPLTPEQHRAHVAAEIARIDRERRG